MTAALTARFKVTLWNTALNNWNWLGFSLRNDLEPVQMFFRKQDLHFLLQSIIPFL